MIRQTIFILLALAATAIVAGCTPAARSAAGANSAIAASNNQAQPQADSPYNQPLMATGGDLVMRQVASRAIAG